MKVTLFLRKVIGGFSVENMAENLLDSLPKDVEAKIFSPSCTNRGLWNKVKSIIEVASHQAEVNHVTGDTHFFTYLMDRRRTILTVWDCERLMNPGVGAIRKAVYKFFWFTLPKRKCRFITTVSEESRRNLDRYAGIKARDVDVIPTGIDRRFKREDIGPAQKQQLFDNQLGKKTVLHVSVSMSNKNVIRLIKALKGLDIKFIKVGTLDKEELRLLKSCAIDYKQFINPSKELLVTIYNAADCLVFPSLIEGFGMPVLEAQACGCPVVTSNLSSLPEVAGEGALLVDPYSTDSIQEGIKKILFDEKLRFNLREKGFSNLRRFEWDKIALEYYELYKKVISGP